MKRILFHGIALVGMLLAGFWMGGRLPTRLRAAPPVDVSGPPKPMTEWYYADGRVNPDNVDPRKSTEQIRTPAREWLVLYNPGDTPIDCAVTFYFTERGPLGMSQLVAPHSGVSIPVHEKIPADLEYGVRVRSSGPVVVQPSRGEYQPGSQVTQAMASFVAYPGPLGKRETKWVYGDGLVLKNENELEEWEWISVLNPYPGHAAKVKLRFETGGHVTTHEVEVGADRMVSVDLLHLDAFPKNKLVGVTAESDFPGVVEQVRRAYRKGEWTIAAMWACLAFPIGDQ